jgi:hypothetical protein
MNTIKDDYEIITVTDLVIDIEIHDDTTNEFEFELINEWVTVFNEKDLTEL